MNIASYQAMAGALDDLGTERRSRLLQQRQQKQQDFENQLRQMAADLQKRQVEAGLASAERDFGYRQSRDQVADTRYGDETGYRRGRDTVADTRDTRDFGYRQGRDQVGDNRDRDERVRQAERDFAEDQFKQMQLALSMQAAKNRGNVGGYVTEELDDEGNVIGTRRRTPLGNTGGRPTGNTSTRPAAGPTSPAELIAAVKAGKMTKDQAKDYAAQQGWN